MKIGVISDTHARTLSNIPAPILEALAGVDLIIHAGDFTKLAVFDGLKALAAVKAVCGNMDSSQLKEILPQKELFVVNGKNVGLIHGSGRPLGIASRIRELFSDVDLIIYGHSHIPYNQYLRGSLLFNGCSPELQ